MGYDQTCPQEIMKKLDANQSAEAAEKLSACSQNLSADDFKAMVIEMDRLDKKGVGGDVIIKKDASGQAVGFDISFPVDPQGLHKWQEENLQLYKQSLRDRLSVQSMTESPGGLDPIIKKGQSLTKDLDAAMKQLPQDHELIDMRVLAGMGLLNAYVHAQDGHGRTLFAKEAIVELTKLVQLKPELAQNDQIHRFAVCSNAASDWRFVAAFEKAGGKLKDLIPKH